MLVEINEPAITKSRLALALNEYMRLFILAPEGFEPTMRTVETFCEQLAKDVEPSFGEGFADYLFNLEIPSAPKEKK
jgi:hypothetical protein